MAINGVSSTNNTYQVSSIAQNKINDYKQAINLEANIEIDLGAINNKPMKMKIFSEGGFEWSGGLRFHATAAGSMVTKEEISAAKAFDAYTKTERTYADRLMSVVNDLYAVTKKGFSVEFFNNSMKGRGITASEIDEALKRLGFNPDKPFTVNGRTFTVNMGRLKETTKINL